MTHNYNKENHKVKKRLKEAQAWYSGDESNIRRFYTQEINNYLTNDLSRETSNYFWAQDLAGQRVRQLHSGIPQLITEKMVDLLIGNGYYFKVVNPDGTVDEYNTERLERILEENNFEFKIQEGIELESALGGFAFKISITEDFNEPVIEIVRPDHYEPVVKAGRIIEDIFDTYYEEGGLQYRLREIYGANKNGAYIKYKLQRRNTSKAYSPEASAYIDVPLNTLDETKNLKDVVLPGISRKLSLYKPNKVPNSEFVGSVLGESDYSGSFGAFDAIDEILSTWIQEFRDGKIAKLWPENLLPRTETGKLTLPPALQKDFIVYGTGIDQSAQKTEPFILQSTLQVDKHTESLTKWLTLVINNAGLSPLTLGITGLESIAANEQSQNAREKTSIRTRNKKLKLWSKALKDLFNLVLLADDVKNNQTNNEDYRIDVVFEDYDLKTTLDKTEEASRGLMAGAWSIKTAVDYIHDDLSEHEKLLEVIRIKIEKNITVFTKEEELAYREFILQHPGSPEGT